MPSEYFHEALEVQRQSAASEAGPYSHGTNATIGSNMFAARYAKEMVVAFSDSCGIFDWLARRDELAIGLLLRTVKMQRCTGRVTHHL
jgi:hypothetical protein